MLVRGEHAHHVPVQLGVRLGAELPKRLLFLGENRLWFRDIVVLCAHKSDMNPLPIIIIILYSIHTDRLTPVWSRPLRWRSNRAAASGGMEGVLVTLNKHIFSSRWLFVVVTCSSSCW